MKEDAPAPPRPPKKRRQLEQALPVWLATWADDEALTPSERRRAQEERDRRKRLSPDVVVGFIGGPEGLSPGQRERVREALAGATEAHHADGVGGGQQFHDICAELEVPVVLHPPRGRRAYCVAERSFRAEAPEEADRAVVRAATLVVAAPREGREPTDVDDGSTWGAIRYARNRGLPVRVAMPDGDLLEKEE